MRFVSSVLWLFLLACAPAVAQVAPLVGSTMRTTDTSSTSVRVGCTLAGSCTGGVVAGPIDVASVTSAGFIGIASNVPASTTMRLYNSAGTLFFNGVALATGSSVSGTLNTIPVFTGASSIGNSIITQNAGATLITVTGALTVTGAVTSTGALTGTLATVSQPNVTTMAGLTSASTLATVGTITSGVWTGQVIDLTRGGAGVSLAGTGGTSQFLRQNSVGATLTVVRPAVSDLSDASNVALLNVSNTFTGLVQTIGSGGTGTAVAAVSLNGGSAAAGGGQASFLRNSVLQGIVGGQSSILGGATNDMSLYAVAGAGWTFYSNALLRWGINSAGDWTFGASSHIADSNGTPTVSGGGGAGASATGNDYAFTYYHGTGTATLSVTINFGHTFTSAPACVQSSDFAYGAQPIQVSTSTTQVLLSAVTGSSFATVHVYVLCRGY